VRAREAPQRYEGLWSFGAVLQNVAMVAQENASRYDTCAIRNAGSRICQRCIPEATLEVAHARATSVSWCHIGYCPMRGPG
jgi:hypothetical protein